MKIIRIRVVPIKVKAYASLLLRGIIQLSDVPRELRLKKHKYYTFAMRYYQYDRSIPNPLEVWKSDLDLLSDDDPQKVTLYDSYMFRYLLNEEQLQEKEASVCNTTSGDGGDLSTTKPTTICQNP